MTDHISDIKGWFELAVPTPTDKNRAVQLGVHMEEVVEMLDAIVPNSPLADGMRAVADDMKTGPETPEEAEYMRCVFARIDRTELLDAVRRTAEGDPVFTPGLAGLVLGEFQRISDGPAAPPSDGLTERETEVLKMVAKGLSYRQIAERLVISHRTVQNHVQSTLRKLHMHNRVELTRYAIERGLDAD